LSENIGCVDGLRLISQVDLSDARPLKRESQSKKVEEELLVERQTCHAIEAR